MRKTRDERGNCYVCSADRNTFAYPAPVPPGQLPLMIRRAPVQSVKRSLKNSDKCLPGEPPLLHPDDHHVRCDVWAHGFVRVRNQVCTDDFPMRS